jgi:8-oxo-dGTP diphosphatase
MASRDGNGWVRCSLGHRHWGVFGAAGLLAYAGPPGELRVLLQRRNWWSHHGGTWGLPGGAADSHETPVQTALREAEEECLVPPDAVTVHGVFTDDHGGWAYRTIFASAPEPFRVFPDSDETDEATWVPVADVDGLTLHPGLGEHWAELREGLAPVTVIVDAANVVGSRPDGWWRDRAGAARRLVTALAALAGRGVDEFPAAARLPAPARWYPAFVAVLEGQARAAADGEPPHPLLRVVTAAGSGDDLIAALAGEPSEAGEVIAGQRLVVTADRELRARCTAAGALVTGPGWLTALLDSGGA